MSQIKLIIDSKEMDIIDTNDFLIIGIDGCSPDIPPVPVPAAVWLFGTALVGFVGIARRRRLA